jgi:transcriptional regulator with XRE-family HTH domain
MSKKTLGDVVRGARAELAITQRELAARVRVKASHIAYLEGNKRKPSLSLIVRLANALGLNQRELLFLSHPEAKALVGEPRGRATSRPHDAWRRFASNRRLRRRHRITPKELRVLKQISLLQDVACSSHFLFILNAIRQAGAPSD